mgnify:CR=1 FL=1
MSKVKKLLAIILSMTMILGMSVTTFADTKDTATITVNDENGDALAIFDRDTNPNGVQLSYAQIIVPDRTTETGWAFVGNTSEDDTKDMTITNAFVNAFTVDDNKPTDQEVINTLIATTRDDENIATTNTAQIAAALSAVASSSISFTTATANPFTVNEAGVYAIKATQERYTYNTMAAYVGFGEVRVDGTTYEYPSLTDAEITAKRAPETVTKSTTDDDKLVAVDSIVTYTIEAYVPFIDPSDENKYFGITDTIYGADYYLEGEGSVAKVEMENGTGTTPVADANDFVVVDGSFDIDLSDLITADNANAGKKITVTYTAKVTGEIVENSSASHVGEDRHDSSKVTVYTGRIVLTKTDEKDTSKKLAGAGFEIRKDDSTGTPLTFTELADGDYVYDEEGTVTEVFTGESGILTVRGLDKGMYYFKETTAPEGYHINNSSNGYDVSVEIKVEGTEAEAVIEATGTLSNTKLSSLPSTGGIGTTIFTIGGCVIMIAAAGLYFASRRRQENK